MESWRQVRTALLLLLGAAAMALGAPGALDTTFDGDGRRSVELSGGQDVAGAVAVQPDGRILVAGTFSVPGADFFHIRLRIDGALDPEYSDDGGAGINFADDRLEDMALAPDGRIVVVGTTAIPPGDRDVLIARILPNGNPDPSFDLDGLRTIDLGGDNTGTAVVVQPDGRILIAGENATGKAVVLRLLSDGSPDPSFNGGAPSVIPIGGDLSTTAMALMADGRIAVGAQIESGDSVAWRLLPSGQPDATLDGDGVRTFALSAAGPGLGNLTGIALQADGAILTAGIDIVGDFIAVRLTPGGAIDGTFDGDGRATVDFGGTAQPSGLVVQANGKIVLAGLARTSAGPVTTDVAVARLQPGGALDTTFDTDGRKTIDVGERDSASDLAIALDGDIVVAGTTSAGNGEVLVARMEGDPPGAGGGPLTPGGGSGPVAGRAPLCAGKRATIVGTPKRDVLRGTKRADVIVALGGDDVVRAGAGADIVCGGAGKDRLLGGPGPDRLLGQGGADQLTGGAGRDLLGGGAGKDRCLGGPGKDGATCERRIGIG